MQTTGFLILNTISNICTFITLALVLIILYYINQERNECKNIKCQNIQHKKRRKHNIDTEEVYPIKQKCIKIPFYNEYNTIDNTNKNPSTEESLSGEETIYRKVNQNTFTPPLQESITFVPENKNMGDNQINTYSSNCS